MKPLCTGVEHGPPDNPYARQCKAVATHRVTDDGLEGFLCAKHAKLFRHMYEPGQLTRLKGGRRA